MELWIARDKDGELRMHYNEPIKGSRCYNSTGLSIRMKDGTFPEITWDSSPKKCKLELL